MCMASMRIEVAASSSPFSHSLGDHNRTANIRGYIHSQCIEDDASWLPSQSSKIDNSWLPTSSQNSSVRSESGCLNHGKPYMDADDSWLPSSSGNNSKGTNTNEPNNDIDYSWLPSTFVDNNKNKKKIHNINGNSKIKTTNKVNNVSDNKDNKNSTCNNNRSSQKNSSTNRWPLASEVVLSCDQDIQNTEVNTPSSPMLLQQDSSSKSRYVVESPTSAGVSSLLQKWKGLAETKSSNKNDNCSPSTKIKENKEINPTYSPPTPSSKKESDANWESDKSKGSRRLSCPLPNREVKDSNPSDAEKEKTRVVDIIKKLSREEELAAARSGNGNESLPPIRTTLKDKQIDGEHKGFKGVKVSRHFIRGRQAYNNFLMKIENDKHHELKWLVERKAVSKFSHRGRIQALLRVRIMRLGVEGEPKPEGKRHRRCISKTLESNNRLDIMDLRERFNSGVEKGATDLRKHKIKEIKNTPNEDTSLTTYVATREVHVKTTTSINKKQEPVQETKTTSLNQSTKHSTRSCNDVVHKAKFADSSSNSIIPADDNTYGFYEDEGQFMSARTSYSQLEDRGIIDIEDINFIDKKPLYENFDAWTTGDYSQTRSDLDDDETYIMQQLDTHYDWISDISRPKSAWEDMRQARYQEMIHHSSGDGDMQRLLQRKSVSRFLGSGLRDVLEQVMVSKIHKTRVKTEKQLAVMDKGELRKEENDGSMVDDDADNRSRTEYSESADQTPSSDRVWKPIDLVFNSETTTTTATTSPSLERSSQNNSTPQSSPAITHRSVETDLLYDLRGHMEQLHQEIMELRKSIKICVNMQVKMQHSFMHHVIASDTATCSAHKNVKKPQGLLKQDCSICGDMQVNSLLYRCGHMCTCFKCGIELQRASGECPICEAPIVDVVKAFVHEN